MYSYDFEMVVFLSEMIDERKAEEAKSRLTATAFNAWITTGQCSECSFTEFQKKVGLIDTRKEVSKKHRQYLIEKSYDVAKRIMALDSSMSYKGNKN